MSNLTLARPVIGLLLVACDRGDGGEAPISVAPTDPPAPTQAEVAAPTHVPAQPTAKVPPPARPVHSTPSLPLAPVVSLGGIRLPADYPQVSCTRLGYSFHQAKIPRTQGNRLFLFFFASLRLFVT